MDLTTRVSLVQNLLTTKEIPASVGAKLLDINRTSIYYKTSPVSDEELACKEIIDHLHTDNPTIPPSESPTVKPTTNPTTQTPTTETPTTTAPTTCPPVEIAVVPSELAPNPETIEEISITSGLCSSYQGTEFILRGLPALKSIEIGNSCFGKVRVFELDGLNELESVVIGKESFMYSRYYERNDGSCRIVNCPQLKSIQIDTNTFWDYHSFELNLPSLQSIDIGNMCFNYAPLFSLTGLIDGLIWIHRSSSTTISQTW